MIAVALAMSQRVCADPESLRIMNDLRAYECIDSRVHFP